MSVGLMPASAHGWYPKECCNGDGHNGDCHEIPESDLKRNIDGSYTVIATGEVFYDPQTAKHMEERFAQVGRDTTTYTPGGYYVRAYRWSEDGHFHRCQRDPNDPKSYTFCLFIPMPSA